MAIRDTNTLNMFMNKFNKKYLKFAKKYGEDDIKQIRDEILKIFKFYLH